MDIFKDFPKFHEPDHPNKPQCLLLRTEELELRLSKRIGRRNQWIAFAAGLIVLFIAGTPLEMVWEFGLGEKVGDRALFICCASSALGVFLLTAPWRRLLHQRTHNARLAEIEAKLEALSCPCVAEKLDEKS